MKRILSIVSVVLVLTLGFCVASGIASTAGEGAASVHKAEAAKEHAGETGSHGEEGHASHKEAKVKNFFWRLIDFTALAVILYVLLAKAVKGFFGGRRESLIGSLGEVRKKKAQAEQKYADCMVRLEKAEENIKEIVGRIHAQGIADKERIIEDAKKAALQMQTDAKAKMEMAFKEASLDLKTEAAELAISIAEELLKKNINEKDHETMVAHFLEGMEKRN